MEQAQGGRKKWLILSAAAVVAATGLFCGAFFFLNRIRENRTPYSAAQITSQIVSQLQYTDLTKVENDQIQKHYDIPDGVVKDQSLYISKTSENASEISCFTLTDASKYPQLQDSIANHISAKAESYKSLNPAQYTLMTNALIQRNGLYVLVAVGSDTSAVKNAFDTIVRQ